MRNVYEMIAAERMAQDSEWGGQENDDKNSESQWLTLIDKHVSRAKIQVTGPAGAVSDNLPPQGSVSFHRPGNGRYTSAGAAYEASLVATAALCIAALESRWRSQAVAQAKAAAKAAEEAMQEALRQGELMLGVQE